MILQILQKKRQVFEILLIIGVITAFIFVGIKLYKADNNSKGVNRVTEQLQFLQSALIIYRQQNASASKLPHIVPLPTLDKLIAQGYLDPMGDIQFDGTHYHLLDDWGGEIKIRRNPVDRTVYLQAAGLPHAACQQLEKTFKATCMLSKAKKWRLKVPEFTE